MCKSIESRLHDNRCTRSMCRYYCRKKKKKKKRNTFQISKIESKGIVMYCKTKKKNLVEALKKKKNTLSITRALFS